MAAVIFWCSVALIVYAYLGYPCVLHVLSLLKTRCVRRGPVRVRVSFIITARNEAAGIAEKIDNTLSQDYPADQLEIIVASDCSTDATDEIVRSYAPRVRLVRASTRGGKEAAQRLAVEASSGQLLIFSDVATALASCGVSSLVRNFADSTVGCVSSIDRFVDADGEPSGEGAYVRYEMLLRQLETRVNTLVGLSGSLFAARREVCRHWSSDRQSDFTILLRAVEMGYRGVLDPHSAGFYRNVTDSRHEFARKIRTVVRGLAVLAANVRMLNPLQFGLFAWQLGSHKLCRWLVPFAMLLALLANASLLSVSATYSILFAAQLGFYAAAAIGLWTNHRALRLPGFLVLANLAVLAAWFRFVRGERMAAWNPSERTAVLPQVNVR